MTLVLSVATANLINKDYAGTDFIQC